MTGYVIEHEGKQFDPDGRADVSDAKAHNRDLEAAEINAFSRAPDQWCGYVTTRSRDSDGYCHLVLTTFLGTVLGDVVRWRDYRDGLGHRMRSVTIRGKNGATYYGRYGYDWRQFVRLRKTKSSRR